MHPTVPWESIPQPEAFPALGITIPSPGHHHSRPFPSRPAQRRQDDVPVSPLTLLTVL